MNLTIRTKLLLLFFALAVAPLVTVGVVSYYNSVAAIEKVVEDRNRAAAAELFQDLQRLLGPRYGEVELLAWNQEIQDFYAAGEAPERPQLDDGIGGFFQQLFTGVYAWLFWLSIGFFLVSSHPSVSTWFLEKISQNIILPGV